jgi:hypothetical protein
MNETKPERLRLSEFCGMIHETKPAVRGMLVRGEVPFDPQNEDEKQRTYDGADLLAWCLFTMLRKSGLSVGVAADHVRASDAVAQFFGAMDRGEDIGELHLIMWIARRERAERGKFTLTGQHIGTVADAAGVLGNEARSYGTVNPNSGNTHLGLEWFSALPILPCYERCVATAKAHGFEMRGADLFEIEG